MDGNFCVFIAGKFSKFFPDPLSHNSHIVAALVEFSYEILEVISHASYLVLVKSFGFQTFRNGKQKRSLSASIFQSVSSGDCESFNIDTLNRPDQSSLRTNEQNHHRDWFEGYNRFSAYGGDRFCNLRRT
jgi:hypothetical protein